MDGFAFPGDTDLGQLSKEFPDIATGFREIAQKALLRFGIEMSTDPILILGFSPDCVLEKVDWSALKLWQVFQSDDPDGQKISMWPTIL